MMKNKIYSLFTKNSLQKTSPIPIYFQLQQLIHNLIQQNKLKEGDKLPTEEELCKIYDISRMTVRQAYDNLLKMELIYKLKGKGTFVSSKKLIFELSNLHSFSEDMKKRGLTVKNEIIEKKIISPNKIIEKHLQVSNNTKILKLKRLRYVQNLPAAIETTFIPLSLCHDLEKEDLTSKSLYNIIEKKYNLKITHSNQTLEPVISNEQESSLLHIKAGSPLIKMIGVTYIKNNIPIEYIVGLYRGDRYKFKLHLKR